MSQNDMYNLEKKLALYEKDEYNCKSTPNNKIPTSSLQTPLSNYTHDKISSIHRFLDDVDQQQCENTNTLNNNNLLIFNQNHTKQNQYKSYQYQQQQSNKCEMCQIHVDESKGLEIQLKQLKQQQKTTIKEKELIQIKFEEEQRRKMEAEEQIKENVIFMDQLIKDKQQLNQQCEELLVQIQQLQSNQEAKQLQEKEESNLELKRCKDAWQAAEKQRRAEWIKKKTSEIKEMTIKGLEGELDRVIMEYQKKLKAKDTTLQEKLAEQKQELLAQHMQDLSEQRQKVQQQSLLQQEAQQQLHNDKIAHYMREIEEIENKHRNRDKQQRQEEQKVLFETTQKEQELHLQKLKSVQEGHLDELQALRQNYQKQINDLQKEHQRAQKGVKEQIALQQEAFVGQERERMKNELQMERQRIRKEEEVERDRQIEHLLGKFLEEKAGELAKQTLFHQKEMNTIKSELQNQLQSVRRQLTHSETQLKEAQQQNKHIEETLQSANKQIMSYQSQQDNNKTNWDEVQQTNSVLQSKCQRLEREINSQQEDFSRQASFQTDYLKKEVDALKQEQTRLILAQQEQVAQLESKHVQQLEQVEVRVKKVFSKKDQDMEKMQSQLQAYQDQIQHLKTLLQKQRQDLLAQSQVSNNDTEQESYQLHQHPSNGGKHYGYNDEEYT